MRKLLFIALLLSGVSSIVSAQDKTQLEKERQELQRELKEMENAYNKIKGQKKQTLGQLSVLNRKIQLQEQYIGSINKELKSIDDDIYLSNLEIYRLQKQLDTLKTQYAKTVVYAYKNKSNYDYLNFIFSANSFNDAIKRIAYLKSYRAYREKKVTTILETQDLIAKRKNQQLGRKEQKNVALTNQTKQVQELAGQKKEKDAVVSELKSKEKDFQKQIATKKKKDNDLKNALLAIVRREIKAAEDKAKAEAKVKAEADAKKKSEEVVKKTANPTTPTDDSKTGSTNVTTTPTTTAKRNEPTTKPTSYLDLNAKDVALNSSFQANKAKLPWPVDNGIVTLRFGPNKIENTLLNIDNPGITISTPAPGATVKVVFDGEVVGVHNMGDGMAVMVRHGKYFTTYSNLTNVSVTKGAVVKTGQAIGRAGKDDDGTGGEIEFILMIESRNIDPSPWLRR